MSDTPSEPPQPVGEDAVALAAAVAEIEHHASTSGWDQSARLFALVGTASLVAREPQLAGNVGDSALTAIEQEHLPGRLEDVLGTITWPDTVDGAAAVVERFVLPPEAEQQLPDDAAEAADFAAGHPDRQEVRIVAGALRTGATWCAMRLRAHDDDVSVLAGPDLVPELLELVTATLEPTHE